MTYFKFKESTKLKVIGRKFPQIETYESGYDFNAEYSISHLNNEEGWKNRKIKTPTFILNKSAKKTDVISSIGLPKFSFIWSEEFYSFLKALKLPEHLVFPLKIQHKEEYLSNYILIHICYPSESSIDFTKSKLCVAERLDKKYDIKINSLSHYYLEKKKYESKSIFDPKIHIEKFVVKENAAYDLFGIGELFRGIYINNSLKRAIQKKGFTGMDFIPIEDLRIGGIW